VQSLGNKHVLVLRNHGIAVAEASIAKTFFLLWIVQRAAEIQCAAGALPGPDVPLPESVKDKCRDLAANLITESNFANEFFAAMVRKMHKDRGPSW
jgi:ribulose-5-phosphate 4-epimerase/fuculose-1-phosphate aldolase